MASRGGGRQARNAGRGGGQDEGQGNINMTVEQMTNLMQGTVTAMMTALQGNQGSKSITPIFRSFLFLVYSSWLNQVLRCRQPKPTKKL